jgi:membrane protein
VVVPFISKRWLMTYVVSRAGGSSYKIITLVLLPIVAGLVFSILGGTYRKIFRLPRRHLVVGQLIASGFAVFIILTLFASNFLLAIVVPGLERALVGSSYLSDVSIDMFTRLTSQYDFISPLVLIAFFLLSVRIFVNVKIPWRYRLFTGALFCSLWLAAKSLFGLYINEISEVNVLYGSLSSIVVLLMWIFYSSIALLYSLEVLYVLNTREHRPPFVGRWRRSA